MPLIEALLALTVVVAVAELFAVLLSLGDETVAVLLSVVAIAGAVTTIVIVALVFGARVAMLQLVELVPVQVQPVAVRETNVVPAGMVSVTTTLAAATVVDGFVTVIVYVSVPLTLTGSGLSVFVIERSAT